MKAEVPAHAQRMSRLLALDKGAPCRVERRAYEAGRVVRAGRREGVGQRWRKRHASGRLDSRLGARARAERTSNIQRMSVTLDVSKLSGWLNADAYYRVERGAYCGCGARCGPGGERALGGGGASGMHGKGLAQGWRRAHLKHAVHVRDAGRVEGQRLVKRPRVLPSRKEGMYDAGRGVGREGAGCRAAAAAQAVCTGRARLLKAVGSIGTRGADPKHLVHAPDLGHVEAQRLVESHRVLPSQKEGIRCGVKCGPGEKAWGGGGASGMHGEGPTQGWGPGHARSARRTSSAWS